MKKIISRNTLLTEIIIDNENKSYIIKRTKENNSHSELISPKLGNSQIEEWKDLHDIHQKELEKENRPNVFQSLAEGRDYATKHIIEVHKNEPAQGEFGVQNIWFDAVCKSTLNWVKTKAVDYIIGVLENLVKDNIPNMVKIADWLLEKLEDEIVQGCQKLDDDYKGVIKNELKQYPHFKRLLEKLN